MPELLSLDPPAIAVLLTAFAVLLVHTLGEGRLAARLAQRLAPAGRPAPPASAARAAASAADRRPAAPTLAVASQAQPGRSARAPNGVPARDAADARSVAAGVAQAGDALGSPADPHADLTALLRRLGGGLLFGGAAVGGALALGLPLLGAPSPAALLAPALPLAIVAALVVWPLAGRPAHRARYPEVRGLARGGPRLALANAAAWAGYLFGYELLFRGLLLAALVPAWGPGAAIWAMTALYALAHLPKETGELWGSLVMGPVFGLLALGPGGVWAAWGVHLAVALASDMGAARAGGGARPEPATQQTTQATTPAAIQAATPAPIQAASPQTLYAAAAPSVHEALAASPQPAAARRR